MVFSNTIVENTSSFEQGLVGALAPFMASNNSPTITTTSTAAAAAATATTNTYTHAVFEQYQQQQQQQSFQQIHHHQHQRQQNDDNNNHQISFGMIPSASSSSAAIHCNFLNKDGGAYDLGELDQALFLYLDSQEQSTAQEQRRTENSGMRPPTLNIFPSQPMHVEPSSSTPAETKATTGTVSPATSGSKRSSEPSMELSNPRNDIASAPQPAKAAVKREGNRKGPTSSIEQEGPKTPDPKALRRLAQNREAARKSRLRKKAYVQQLESSRIRLTQLEQEIQRARTQGIFLGGGLGGDQQGQVPAAMGNINSVFDMEYARWLDEHQRLMVELRNAVQDHLPENELRIYVGNCLAHYDQIMNLKSMIIKSDVFHIISGMWKTPAERCFMWIGGFRPSEIMKIISSQVEPLTEQQLMGICGLQQSTHEAEEALSQGLEALNQSLSEILISDPLNLPPDVNTFMSTMAVAINKLSTLEGFVRQADHLRHQTLHRLHQLLTTRQSARCFLAMAEYFHRLRALSSLWLARPRQD